MNKVLVIGAGGLLGSKLMLLGKTKYQMYGTYNKNLIASENFFQLDATKRQDVFNLIGKIKPDLVIDTHSVTNVDYCETHHKEAWLVNVEGTKNITEACKTVNAKMIFISTDYVFDGSKTDGYTENSETNPLNQYGKTKLAAEKAIEASGVDHIIARTAVLYGIGGVGKLAFPLWVLDKLKKNEKIKVVIDQYSNPTFANNLAKILFALYENNAKGLFHVTGSDCVNRYEFAKLTAKTFGLDESLIKTAKTSDLKQIALRPEKLNINTEKLQRVIGTKPIGVGEGLRLLKRQIL